jgi:molybdopterin-guanine dinucleotide biosynthesis protein A
MTIAGIIVAGGEGTRIGGRKPLLPFGDGVLLDAVIAIAQPQVSELALNIPRGDEPEYRTRYGNRFPLVFDSFVQGTGPLAGIVAGLEWMQGRVEWLAVFPCDTPFLPRDLVSKLSAARNGDRPVAAEYNNRLQGLCSLWPANALGALRSGVADGTLRSPQRALDVLGGVRCRIDAPDAFVNINSIDDLERARRMGSGGRQ